MAKRLVKPPPLFLEYIFYAVLVNELFFLVKIPFMQVVGYSSIAAVCLIHFGKLASLVWRPIALALGCAIFTVLVQLVIHEESIRQTDLKSFIIWAFVLIVIQSLSVRKGFFHRFAIVAFLLGLGTIPYMTGMFSDGEYQRVTLEEGIGLGSANGLSMWFGFCFIYFLIAGLEAKHNIVRGASWACGFICLIVMGMTVSRGSLIGAVMATALAFRRVLKRSFLPVIGFLFMGWIVFLTGVADDIIFYYSARGLEDTGRFYVWTKSFENFLDSWWGGVGLSNAYIQQPGHRAPTPPHNGFLLIGLSSGVVPLTFFMGYIWYAMRGALQSRKEKSGNSPYLLPMFLFCMLELMILGLPFMSPWFMVVFSAIFVWSERNYLHLGQVAGNKTYSQGEVYGSSSNSLNKVR